MKSRLVELLCCPEDGLELRLVSYASSGDEVRDGALVCEKGHSYPIINYIPRFVRSDQYVKSFSVEWLLHAKTQYDSVTGLRNSEQSFLYKTGFKPWELRGKLVLDAGCGSGRFIEVCKGFGAEVIGMDMSFAVDGALSVLGLDENVHLIQADIMNPPFKSETFDYIFSIGVLHHTPDPKHAFIKLCNLLKPGGRVAIWVYPDEGFWVKLMNRIGAIYRVLARSMTLHTLYNVCREVQRRAWIPRILLESGDLDPRKTLSTGYHHPKQVVYLLFPFFSLAPTLEWRVLDTFDYLSPRFQSKHLWREVALWFKEAGMTDIRKLPVPISVSGSKPMTGGKG